VRPSAAWYGLAGVFGFVGLAVPGVLIVLGAVGFVDRVDGFQRVDVPGSAEVRLGAGGYVLYYEAPGLDSESGGTSVPPLDITLRSPTGEVLPLSDYDGGFTYSIGSHDGRAIGTVQVNDPGTYRLTVAERPGSAGVVAVGRGMGRWIVGLVLAAVLSFFLFFAAATVIAVLTAVRRGRSKRGFQRVHARSQAPTR
jgi:hypothetical protein